MNHTNLQLGMAIKPLPIYNPQNPPHLKPNWVAEVGFKRVWAGMEKTGKDTATGMGIGLNAPNPPRTRTRFVVC